MLIGSQELVKRVQSVLAGDLSIDNFQDWFAVYFWNIHKRASAAVQHLAYGIDLLLDEYTSDDLSESELRTRLAVAIFLR
jgi:hypothetical protein